MNPLQRGVECAQLVILIFKESNPELNIAYLLFHAYSPTMQGTISYFTCSEDLFQTFNNTEI